MTPTTTFASDPIFSDLVFSLAKPINISKPCLQPGQPSLLNLSLLKPPWLAFPPCSILSTVHRLYACLACAAVSCPAHAPGHAAASGHEIAVDVDRAEIFCCACRSRSFATVPCENPKNLPLPPSLELHQPIPLPTASSSPLHILPITSRSNPKRDSPISLSLDLAVLSPRKQISLSLFLPLSVVVHEENHGQPNDNDAQTLACLIFQGFLPLSLSLYLQRAKVDRMLLTRKP